jgi:hypothetical protein
MLASYDADNRALRAQLQQQLQQQQQASRAAEREGGAGAGMAREATAPADERTRSSSCDNPQRPERCAAARS